MHDYTLIRCLGQGSFGEVWEATAPGGIPAAVKIIHCTRSQAAAQLELDALELLRTLKHAYLLPTYASYIDPDQVVIAMELADGTLRQRLQFCQSEGRPGLPIGELLHYMRQAADALDYLHSQKKLHRDVKPDNLLIFLGPPPYIKVGDCGLLREHADSDETMTTLGTPPYMALEVWRRMACAQSDLYSLAVTYVELRQGKRPFNPSPGVSLFDAQLNHEPDLSGLEEAEKEVVRKSLSKDPHQRHESCLAFVEELERALKLPPGKFRPTKQVGLAPVKSKPDHAVPGPRPPRTTREAPPPTLGTNMPHAQERGTAPAPSLPTAEDSWAPDKIEPTQGIEEGQRSRPGGTPPPTPMTTWVAVVLVLAALAGVGYLVRGVFVGTTDEPVVSRDKDKDTDKDREKDQRVVRDGEKEKDQRIDQNGGKEKGKASKKEGEKDQGKTEPPKPPLPSGFVAEETAGQRTVAHKGTFYRAIARDVKGHKVRFWLVYPRGEENWAPFYLMENKAWNSLFRAVADGDGPWKKGGKKAHGKQDLPADEHPDLPVLRVTRAEAEAFARALGGRLPTAEELDRAAARPEASPGPPKSAAIGRGEQGPRPVSEDSDDVSWAGVRDLLGNGREWTRSDVKDTGLAQLRGQSYTAVGPLSLAALQEQIARGMTPRQDPGHASPYTGFRVVVEVPAAAGKD